ncbi:MAG: DMT family transporter [Bacillota bacterium]
MIRPGKKNCLCGLPLNLTCFLLALVPLIWSTNFIIGKILVRDIPPLTITAIRVSVAGVFLILLLRYNEKRFPRIEKKDFLPLAVMGFAGVFGFNSLIYTGLKSTTSTNSAIINGIYPVLTAVLSVLVLKEAFRPGRLIGLVFSLAGVFIIAVQGSWGVLSGLRFNSGDILALAATLSWSVYSIAGKMVMGRLSPLCATTYSTLFGLVFIYPAMAWELAGAKDISLSWNGVAAIVYLGIFSSVIAASWWNRGVNEIGPEKSGHFYNLLPVYSACLAAYFLNESIHWYHILGGGAVLCGVYLGSRSSRVSKNSNPDGGVLK